MLLEKIQQNASLLAEHPAYRCGEEFLTYSQLWNAACLLGRAAAGRCRCGGADRDKAANDGSGDAGKPACRPALPAAFFRPAKGAAAAHSLPSQSRHCDRLSGGKSGTIAQTGACHAEFFDSRRPFPGTPIGYSPPAAAASQRGCASPLPRWKISCAGFVRSQQSAPERNRSRAQSGAVFLRPVGGRPLACLDDGRDYLCAGTLSAS